MDIREQSFREQHLFSQADVLKSLELFMEHEKTNERGCSTHVLDNRVKLCERLYVAAKRCKLPPLTELWWFYDYEFLEDRMQLTLCQASDIEVENVDISVMTFTVEHKLLSVQCDYLTVEQYASMLGVKPVTVRQWIERGKLRHARKTAGEWLIPNTVDRPGRGYDSVQYIVEGDAKIESEEFPVLAVSSSITIVQSEDARGKFTCYLRNDKNKFYGTLELTRSDVERLEHTIIESGKAIVEENIQYVPDIRSADE